MFLNTDLEEWLLDNHVMITKPVLIVAGLLLTVVSSPSQFVDSAFAQTAKGTCTRSGIQITCSGTVSGLRMYDSSRRRNRCCRGINTSYSDIEL